MDKGEESSSSHQVYPDQVVHAPVTPAKPGQPDPSVICKNLFENPFDEVIFEEASMKKSFSCWDGNLGSTSQTHDVNGGMYYMDDLEKWNRISCRDLLAFADGGIEKGSNNDTQQFGGLNLHNYLTDLNLPPETVPEPHVSTGLSLQFTPVTPDSGRRAEHKQVESDLVISNEDGRMNVNLDEQSQGDVSIVVEANQDVEKGLTEQTDLNETPQPKQRRRKHRPKVVTENKRKRPKTPATPKPDGSTGKRKYVRRKGVEKPVETPVVEEASGAVDPSTDQQAKKTCKRKINFDEHEQQTEVMVEKVEKTQVEHTVDKTCSTSEVENYQKVVESGSPSPITPSKTEVPQGRSKENTKAKCKINFLQETHDKRPGSVPSPNESNCSSSTCFSKGEHESSMEGIRRMQENTMGICRESLETFLSVFTDYSNTSLQGLQLQELNKRNKIEKNKSVMTASTSASKYNQNSKKKKTNGLAMMHDSISFGGMMAHSGGFQLSITTNKKIKKKPMAPSLYHDHRYSTNYLGGNPNFRYKSVYDLDALVYQFGRLNINTQMVQENLEAVIPYMSGYHEKNALVVYQQNGSLVPYEGLFNPVKRRKPRPKVDLDDETSRVWRLLLEDINSQGIDGTDEAKAKWWEEERRVFRGRADSFIARMHLVQGDRRFSRWKGSVLDSVVGVFLTQNVSDHLSSSAFMSLASRYPPKPKNSSEPLHEDIPIMSVKQPYQVEEFGEDDPVMLQDNDSCEDKEVVNSNELSKNSTSSNVDLNENSESEKNLEMYKESVIDQTEVDDIVSSQNSANTSPSSVQSSIANTTMHTSFVELLHMQGPTTVHETIIQKKIEKCVSEESGISAESASQTTVQMVKTISSQESAKSFNNVVEASGETVHKVVEFHLNGNGGSQIVNGADEGTSKVTKEKTGKKEIKVDWDKLRLQAEVKQKREKTPNCMDSLDYEAVRTASVDEVADTIKERGMNNVLAARIKAVLDRLVKDHGSTDLEWLRDVPPDKAKEYLLSFRGLGLKSVECIRLLTLHHLAFPVDTNVGRIAVRLGWVPLQPLPESLQLHLLELYPVLESIQKYLWPRLCKLDQPTLYELHYQMITFGKVFCTKTRPNCNACPLRGECRHFASAFASARLGLPAPEESKSLASLTENRIGQTSVGMIDLPPPSEKPQQVSEVQSCNPVIEETTTPGPIVEVPATPGPIIEVPASPEPIVEVPATPEPEQIQQDIFDIEDYGEDPEEIPMIKLNIEQFTQNLQTYMERHMELGEGDMSKALVALTTEAASIPTPKLKNVSQLRTEHQVYELPDSHPLLEGLDTREPDDPCSYLLAIWTPGETADSIQPPEGQCSSQESGVLCNEETCFFCNSTREANAQTVRGTLLIPCRTAMRGSFPLNGTYFQVNEVFADHDSSLNPIDVPRSWLWNLPRRTVYFGTSIPTIFKGLTTEDIQYCFWRGFVCVRGFDQKTRAPRPLMARLHFPASRLKRSMPKTDDKEKLKQ